MADRLTIKRLNGEIADLDKNRNNQFQAVCDESDMFTFYFLLRDLDGPYEGGIYIGKILLPPEYPRKAGDIVMLTPNGRFQTGSKICLTNSGYHPESWTPMWTIRNILLGFISVFVTDDTTGIAHIRETPGERKIKAENSYLYNKTYYSDILQKFHYFVNIDLTLKTNDEINKIVNVPVKQKEPVKEPVNIDKTKLDEYSYTDFIDYFKKQTLVTFDPDIYKYFIEKF